LRAYRQLDRYELRSSFGTWVSRIAANYALDLVRSKRRNVERQPLADEQGESLFDRIRSGEPDQERLLLSAEVRKRFDQTMAALSHQERTAFEMRHFDGMSIEQIGSVLNLGDSAAKNSIFRAVRKLRAALEPLLVKAELEQI